MLDSLRGEMTAILIFVRPGGMWQCDAESGETVRKVKHSSVTIANPLSALDREGYGVFQSHEDFSDGLVG